MAEELEKKRAGKSLILAGALCVALTPVFAIGQTLWTAKGQKPPAGRLAEFRKTQLERYELESHFLETGSRSDLLKIAASRRSAGDHASANSYLRFGAMELNMPIASLLLAWVHIEGLGCRPKKEQAVFWTERALRQAKEQRDAKVADDARFLLSRIEGANHEAK